MAGFNIQDLLNNLTGVTLNQPSTALYDEPQALTESYDIPSLDDLQQQYSTGADTNSFYPGGMGGGEEITQAAPWIDPDASISDKIQQFVGAKEPSKPTAAGSILSSRFGNTGGGPSYSDYSQAIQKSAYGTPTGALDIANSRFQNQFKTIAALSKMGGVNKTPAAIQEYEYYNSLPEAQKRIYLESKRNVLGPGQFVGANGNAELAPGFVQNRQNVKMGESLGSKSGENLALNQQALPGAMQAGQLALKTIDDALMHPGFDKNFGMYGMLKNRPGSEAANARTFIDQIGGQNFLTAYATLKGGGQITEIEGAKAEVAIARLQSAQSPESARAALNDLRTVILTGINRAQMQANGQGMEFNPSETLAPNQGLTPTGRTSKGRPVYQDAQGNLVVE